MRIGIVAPSSVPAVRGGAENLYAGLLDHLNRGTSHEATLVTLASPEGDFWALMESYRAFSELDVSRFDLVISTKYPAWMVSHPNHVCYMLHCLRGLYDTYHLFGLPVDPPAALPARLLELRRRMRDSLENPRQLSEFFSSVFELREDPECGPGFQFPGPLTREIVHYLDAYALRKGAIARHAAISKVVAARSDYFPQDVSAVVAYPPSGLETRDNGPYEYFFTASRLDAPKRIDLIVRAFRMVGNANARLKIAGTGPEDARLRALAKGDPRIEFLGYVDNQRLSELYSGARAVLFTPYDEDLGYITMEAMRSGKPVVTTSDAGGPLEFIRHGENGLVADPSPESLARCIEQLARDRELCVALGEQGSRDIASVTWEKAVASLLPMDDKMVEVAASTKRKKVVVLSTFPIYPPVGGGQCRIYHLWRRIARVHDLTVVSSVGPEDSPSRQLIAEGMYEVRVPRSRKHAQYEVEASRALDWTPVTDVIFAMKPELAGSYRDACAEALEDADLCILEHPYTLPVLDGLQLPELWYAAQNHEASMKSTMLPATEEGRRVVAVVEEVEAEMCRRAARVIAVSEPDRDRLKQTYGVDDARFLMSPNGVDLESITFVEERDRAALRHRMGMEHRPVAVMLASWHGPNLEAVEDVIAVADHFEQVDFIIIGSACKAIELRQLPANVHLVGVVDDEEKDVLLGMATVALNPMRSGGGSNLKLLDYMASGVGVVTSEFGARGSDIDTSMAWLYTGEGLEGALSQALTANPAERQAKARAARRHVERRFSWDVLGDQVLAEIGVTDRARR